MSVILNALYPQHVSFDIARKRYEENAKSAAEEIKDEMCFCPEWFHEAMPIENKESTMVDHVLNDMRQFAAGEGHWPTPEVPQNPPKPKREEILIFSDNIGWTEKILDNAPENRVGRTKIVRDHPDSIDEAKIAQLVTERNWDMIIFATGLDPPESSDSVYIIKRQNEVMKLYLYLIKEIFRSKDNCKRLAVLTRSVFSDCPYLHERIGLGVTTNACLFGTTNSARLELEDLPIHYVDVDYDPKPAIWPMLASELFCKETFGQNCVRLMNDDGRFVLRQMSSCHYAVPEIVDPYELPEEGIIAITGGNGSLGLILGDWLLSKADEVWADSSRDPAPYACKGLTIKFLSRSTKINDPNNEKMWKKIQKRAEKLGVVVEQTKCDFSSAIATREFIASCSPHLRGIIHAAGILQDAMLTNQTWEKFDAVFESKHRAALFIHDALAQCPNPDLKFFFLFSSQAVWGNMGQTPYSGSNAYLDAIARHRKAMGLVCTAIQWGAWGEAGMAANLDAGNKRRMAGGPQPPFTNEEGLRGMEKGMTTNLPYFSVFKFNTEVMFAMVNDDTAITGCWSRNFSCEMFPTPAPSKWDRSMFYVIYREFMEQRVPHWFRSDRMAFSQFTAPLIEELEG